jgi:hypothetical protein
VVELCLERFMKFISLFFVLFLSACSNNFVENPDIEKVKAQETDNCTFNQDIGWELNHGVSSDKLIEALNACKHPKFKRGDIFLEKRNKNCIFQVYYADVVYPDRLGKDEKISALYVGQENCNGLINDLHFAIEGDLVSKRRRK